MNRKKRITAFILMLFLVAAISSSCQNNGKEVVVYTSVDQVYSEPILRYFEEQTGIKVKPVYDIEATKTVGLVNRLISEKDNPQADVFWSGEFVQTILLKEKGVLTPYLSPNASDIPSQYVDPDNFWTGFAGRARVLLVNTDLVSPDDYPDSIYDLVDDTWPADQTGIAYPLFGTTATHAAALYAAEGAEKARDYFTRIYERGVRVVDGNSVVRDMVESGQMKMGMTDTDDSCAALEKGEPVAIIFPDQDSLGTFVIPNTVAMIQDGPSPDEAEQLIDFLLSVETAKLLIENGWCQIPLRPIDARSGCNLDTNIVTMQIDLKSVYNQLETASKELTEIFLR
ncbi:MAG: extracellular solute-binding protein [Dehalococcoidales bacterium]|nr:MAG: extracellular solute-binding protein [Dehalococcoidales bacterium]